MNNHPNLLSITRKQTVFIKDVLFLEANKNYTIIHLSNGKQILAAATLKLFENKLPKEIFFRPNKSFIIHKDFIKTINIDDKAFVLKNSLVIQASRRKAPFVLKLLSNHQ